MKLDFISQPSSMFKDYSICNNVRLIFNQFLLQVFDPNEWCLKNGLLSGGLNPRPLSHESSALTTRPRLLAIVYELLRERWWQLHNLFCLSKVKNRMVNFYIIKEHYPFPLIHIKFFVLNFMKILSLLYHLQSTVFCKKKLSMTFLPK